MMTKLPGYPCWEQICLNYRKTSIEKCSSLPDYFPVTTEMVKGYLTRGLTLEEEMEVGLMAKV